MIISVGGKVYSKTIMALLYFICRDKRPFNIVQGEGFKRLMKELVPLFIIPCPATLKKALDNKYEIMKTLFIEKLEVVPQVSLTFDIWTETMTETSYFGVTIHYLEKSALVSRCLAVTELKERHNSDYTGEVFNNILQDFNINKENVVTVVTDNGSNMIATVQKILGKKNIHHALPTQLIWCLML